MTPEDLDAIRARDAENRLLRLGPDADPDLGEWMGYAVRDRRALLAEVDRLTGVVEAWETALSLIPKAVADAEAAERARIRAAVEGLPEPTILLEFDGGKRLPVPATGAVFRAAVLAAIDGGEAKGYDSGVMSEMTIREPKK